MFTYFDKGLNNLETIFAEERHKGMPPPGWTVPPVKYKPFIFLEKFGCLLKAAKILLELAP
jgi:hypothetical protein